MLQHWLLLCTVLFYADTPFVPTQPTLVLPHIIHPPQMIYVQTFENLDHVYRVCIFICALAIVTPAIVVALLHGRHSSVRKQSRPSIEVGHLAKEFAIILLTDALSTIVGIGFNAMLLVARGFALKFNSAAMLADIAVSWTAVALCTFSCIFDFFREWVISVTCVLNPIFALATLTLICQVLILFTLLPLYAPKKGAHTFAQTASQSVVASEYPPARVSKSDSTETHDTVPPASHEPNADEDVESNGPVTPIPEFNDPYIEFAQVRTNTEDDRETLEWERRAEAELEYRCDRTGRVPRPDWLGPEPYVISPENMPDMSYYPQPPRAFRRPASPPSVVVGNLNRPGRGAYRGSGRPRTRALPSPLSSPLTSSFATKEEKQVDTGSLALLANNPHAFKHESSSSSSDSDCAVSFGHNKGLYEDRQKQEKRMRDAEIALRVERRRRERKAQEAEARKTLTKTSATMQMIPSTSYQDDPMLAEIESTPALWETVDFEQLNKAVLANLGPTTTYLPTAGC